MFERIKNHFKWSKWVSVGFQTDRHAVRKYQVFVKVNANGLNRYKAITMTKARCYPIDLELDGK